MEGKLYDILHVVADALNIDIEYMLGILEEEANQHNEHTNREADLAQPSDSYFQATDHRGSGTRGYAPNDDDLVGFGEFDFFKDSTEAGVHLDAAEAQAGANAKHRTTY